MQILSWRLAIKDKSKKKLATYMQFFSWRLAIKDKKANPPGNSPDIQYIDARGTYFRHWYIKFNMEHGGEKLRQLKDARY